MAYEHFYTYYDLLMNEVPYDDYLMFIKDHCQKTSKLLDLGCGTGNLLVELVKEGYHVDGLDINEEMLLITQEKLHQKNLYATLYKDDMRDLQIKEEYNLIYCCLNTMNYLTDMASLEATCIGVFDALVNRGCFLFDVHSIDYVNQHFDDYYYHEDFEDFTYLWNTQIKSLDNQTMINHDLSFYVHQKDQLFERFDESHQQIVYPISTYISLLTKIGFKDISIQYGFDSNTKQEKCDRIFVTCNKYKS